MKITFADKDLATLANDDRKRVKAMGQRRADLVRRRLTDLTAAESLEDVRHLPGRYHELTGDLKGQWACDLDHPYRLIFTPQEDPIPVDKDGRYIWQEIHGVNIITITDYH